MLKELYMPEVEAGYISRAVHPENNNIVILNYTEKTVYERHWNDITITARGLILDESTERILARPFKKFFNYGENPDEIIPSGNPTVTVKYDGSLGISYILNGRLRWTTRGSFTSRQAKIAQEIWNKKYEHKYQEIRKKTHLDEITLLVEIIHPETRVVVNYNFSDLVLIGAMHIPSGYDYDYSDLCKLASLLGIPITQKVDGSLSDIVKLAKILSPNEEGFVLRWPDGFRLKVKGDEYLKVHRILYGLSEKQKIECWINNTVDDLIKQLPEEFRKEIEESVSVYNSKLLEVKNVVLQLYEKADKTSRKDFALWVNSNVNPNLKGFMFALYDNKNIDNLIKKYIYKNYKELFQYEFN